MKTIPYKIEKSGDGIHVVMGGKRYRRDLGNDFAKLKADAEERVGEKITEAVITVPAYFDDTQRQATKREDRRS